MPEWPSQGAAPKKDIDLSGLPSAENLKLPEKIERYLNLLTPDDKMEESNFDLNSELGNLISKGENNPEK